MTFVGITAGIALVIGSACVVNNMIDRNLDAQMKRTKKREVATGNISLTNATIYALILGVAGFGLLIAWTNWLTAILGVVAYVWYIVVYGIAKRTTPLSTIIGTVCGALPPMAGYTAVTGQLDAVAWTLFLMMMAWQLPHFYAIAIFRRDDYRKVKIPVWSVRYGNAKTKMQIFFWMVVFAALVPVLTVLGATGYSYLIVMLGASIYWLYKGAVTYQKLDEVRWAGQTFGISLVVLLVMCGAIGLGGYLP